MSHDRASTGDPRLHTWPEAPHRRQDNQGLGCCNTGSGKQLICAIGGIGCDVDHIQIARANLAASIVYREALERIASDHGEAFDHAMRARRVLMAVARLQERADG